MATPLLSSAHTGLGILGMIISGLLFISPCPTIYHIWRSHSSLEFKPHTHLSCLLNCCFWILYSLPMVHPTWTAIIIVNGLGFLSEFFYLMVFYTYSTPAYRRTIPIVVTLEMISTGLFAVLAIKGFQTPLLRTKVGKMIYDSNSDDSIWIDDSNKKGLETVSVYPYLEGNQH